jgi:hypothetical protein
MSHYMPYYLQDNPFPVSPFLDPSSDNDRVNGRIYNPHIQEAEIRSFESKIRQRLPLIYIENSVFERGVGKSALLVQQWRQLQKQADVTSNYIRSKEKFMPVDFATHLIERWHQESHLWRAVLQILAAYVKDNPQSEMSLAGFNLFREKLPSLPRRPISLTHFNVFNPKRLINDLATLAQRQAGDHLHIDLARVFFETYLTDPSKFLETYPTILRKRKSDHVAMLAGVYRLLRLGGFQYHYLFFDQFENVIHGMTGKTLITFAAEMRRLIEASLEQATIIVTLHPGAKLALSTHEADDIRSIAPLDPRYVIDVRPLTKEGAHQLALTYLDHYRVPNATPSELLYPFTPEAIDDIHTASRGNIRACLQAFNYAIECGKGTGFALIDKSFLTEHHAEVTGRVHPEDVAL